MQRFALLVLVAALALVSTAGAEVVVSINFPTPTETHTLLPGESTGAVDAANWNNVLVEKSTDPNNDVFVTYPGTLVDGGGNPTGLGLNWRAGQKVESTVSNPDPANGVGYRMMGSTFFGDKTGGDGGKNEYIELTGLAEMYDATNTYDVYIYFGGGRGYGDYDLTIDGSDAGTTNRLGYLTYDGAYVEDIQGDTSVEGNYLVIPGLQADTVRAVIHQRSGAESGISGVQVVSTIPEPATLAVLSVGGLIALKRRRR